MKEASTVKGALAFVSGSMPVSAQKTRATAEGGSKKGRSYKPFPKEFRRGGFEYRQIYREGGFAIYEQRWSGCPNPSPCYEVIRIRRREGFQIGARFIEPAEVYPNSNVWGVDGFTFTDRDPAFAKVHKLRDQNATASVPR